MIIHLIADLLKMILYKNGSILPKPYEPFDGDINVNVDLSNYAQNDISKTFHMLIFQVLH